MALRLAEVFLPEKGDVLLEYFCSCHVFVPGYPTQSLVGGRACQKADQNCNYCLDVFADSIDAFDKI
jgi:hypothetical protein